MSFYLVFAGEQYDERAGGMESFFQIHTSLGSAMKAAREHIEDMCSDWANIAEVNQDGSMRWWSNGPRGLEDDVEFDPDNWQEMNMQPWQFEIEPARPAEEADHD